MRIKELSARTGVPARLLRYYEEQGLLRPRREDNGYRSYDEPLVARVRQIRGLLEAGLTTEIIRTVMPCLAEAACSQHDARDFVGNIRRERNRMAERVAFLSENLHALNAYLDAIAGR